LPQKKCAHQLGANNKKPSSHGVRRNFEMNHQMNQ